MRKNRRNDIGPCTVLATSAPLADPVGALYALTVDVTAVLESTVTVHPLPLAAVSSVCIAVVRSLVDDDVKVFSTLVLSTFPGGISMV